MIAERLQQSELFFGKGIEFGMRCSKHTDQAIAHKQWNRDFRLSRGFTGDVVRINANVGRVAKLAGGGDVSDHALFANLQIVALVIHGAATDTRELHHSSLRVVQIDVGFNAAKGTRDVVHDAIDEFVEVENGGDL